MNDLETVREALSDFFDCVPGCTDPKCLACPRNKKKKADADAALARLASTSLTSADLRLARWCVFTISKGFQAEHAGQVAAAELTERLDTLIAKLPPVTG